MELSDLIQLTDEFLRKHRNDPHQLAAFKYQVELLLGEYATDIPFDSLEISELIEKRTQFEAALKNANSLSNEVLIRHRLKEIEERIAELTASRMGNTSLVG